MLIGLSVVNYRDNTREIALAVCVVTIDKTAVSLQWLCVVNHQGNSFDVAWAVCSKLSR